MQRRIKHMQRVTSTPVFRYFAAYFMLSRTEYSLVGE